MIFFMILLVGTFPGGQANVETEMAGLRGRRLHHSMAMSKAACHVRIGLVLHGDEYVVFDMP